MRFCWLLVVGNRGGSCVTLFVAAVAPGRPTGNPDTVLYMLLRFGPRGPQLEGPPSQTHLLVNHRFTLYAAPNAAKILWWGGCFFSALSFERLIKTYQDFMRLY